jgi:nudix-type nucleoside diphosphatase (YffH/AdpP family)
MSDIVRMERVPGSEISRDAPIADESADVVIAGREVLAPGFRPYERLRARRTGEEVEVRDLLRAGPAVAVLPIDLRRGEVVLIRQFRLAAHLANEKGDLVEIVAGHVEANETPLATARRECVEEIGVAPDVLVELFSYLPSPGLIDEEITLFLGNRRCVARGGWGARRGRARGERAVARADRRRAGGACRRRGAQRPAHRCAAVARAQPRPPRRDRARGHDLALTSAIMNWCYGLPTHAPSPLRHSRILNVSHLQSRRRSHDPNAGM